MIETRLENSLCLYVYLSSAYTSTTSSNMDNQGLAQMSKKLRYGEPTVCSV